jgi:WD40 repeat protein
VIYYSGLISSVVFSPDGELLAAISIGVTVEIWQTSTGTLQRVLVAFLPGMQRPEHHSGRPTDMPEASSFPPSEVLEPPFYGVDRTGWVWRLSVSGVWRQVSWLPVERRSRSVVCLGQKLAVVADSGKNTVLNFSNVDLN